MITSLSGTVARSLGLAVHPAQDPRCVRRAFERGVNFFGLFGFGHRRFIEELASILWDRRDEIIVAAGSEARKRSRLTATRRRIFAVLDVELLDVFFMEYVNPKDNLREIFDRDGVLDELQRWKADGLVRYVGATVHDPMLAKRLAEDPRVDVLMLRFNMAHRKAVHDVFPTAIEAQTPIIAFTATRWGTLLRFHAKWPANPPTAADCYRYCLAHPPVQLVLTAPRSIDDLDENLSVLKSPPMKEADRQRWELFGDVVYGRGRDAYEKRWP